MRVALLSAGIALICAAPAAAAPQLVSIGSFSAPVHVASPPNDGRVFVVEQGGLVKIAGGGTFLDATGLTDGGGERGLLSIAFSPDYATSGLFYVFLTAQEDGALKVLEFQRSADPNVANPTPTRELLRIPHPETNHNGGQLQFGPDGMLYVSTGDGGGSGNAGNAQDPASLLGKILRIDPRAAQGDPLATRVWHLGLRNPWRFTFDRATGDMVIGDVGQNDWEEVNWVRAAGGRGAGVNFGWPACEGNHPSPCPISGAVPPAFERSHADGFVAITGGYVVRDPGLPTLAGRYLYGDYAVPNLRSITLGAADDRVEPLAVSRPSSFGEDACGRLYVATLAGPVFRIQDGAPSPCTLPVTTPAPPTQPTAMDRRAPRLRVKVLGLRRRHLRVRVRCDEACRVRAAGRLRGVGRLRATRRALPADRRAVLRLRMSRRTAAKLRRRERVRAVLTVRARDQAGNERRIRRRPKLRV